MTEPRTQRYSPLWQLVLTRLREFYREPEAVFWVYGFPILLTLALGIAFRNQPVEQIGVDVVEGPASQALIDALKKHDKFKVQSVDLAAGRLRLRTGRTELVVVPGTTAGPIEYLSVPTRPESRIALKDVDDALQRDAGRKDPIAHTHRELDEPGGRYIDFLVPGLLGMGLMGGGLWGVGFGIVDMRIRKLLKRFLATPMKKTDFLGAIMISRLVFMIPEVLILLVFARYVFGVKIEGSVFAVVFLIILGAFTFAGIGLLVACRAKTLEAVSGLMNLVMLPMWVLSGIFFSSERFPEAAQPLIKLIPLTPLINSLRAVMLEGKPLSSQLSEIAILAAWGVITFILGLRWVRWQ
jgi:ABC-type multidrug transport system permease subunit